MKNYWIRLEYHDRRGQFTKHFFSASTMKRVMDVLSVQMIHPSQITKTTVNDREIDFTALKTLLEGKR